MKPVLAGMIALCIAAAAAAQQNPIDYRFDAVKHAVTLTTAKATLPVARGQHAASGDLVKTGWFSYALIAAEPFRAKFEIFSSTDVKLASGAPGVILSLERGKIHAMFDKITGNEPRVVQTPGALLAVRGTQYDAEVDKDGRTTLRVSEGTVEVRSELRKEPFFVHAGEMTTFSHHDMPSAPRPMSQNGEPEHRGGQDDHGRDDHGRGMMPPQGQHPPPTMGGHH